MRKRMITMGLLAGLAVCWLPATTAQAGNTTPNRPRSKGSRSRKPPVDKGPGETRAERDLRLQRECRGRPNSGACEGYAN